MAGGLLASSTENFLDEMDKIYPISPSLRVVSVDRVSRLNKEKRSGNAASRKSGRGAFAVDCHRAAPFAFGVWDSGQRRCGNLSPARPFLEMTVTGHLHVFAGGCVIPTN